MQPAVPYPPHRQQPNAFKAVLRQVRAWHFTVLLLVTAVVTLLWSELQATASLPNAQRQSHSFASDAADTELRTVDDLLVAQIVQQCMQQQETFIWLQRSSKGQQQLAVYADRQPQRRPGVGGVGGSCGVLHIPLASSDRSIGLCTDAALYVQLLGAWIAPATDSGLRHAQQCDHRSAVMFLEPLYEPWMSWLQQRKHVVTVFAPNFEQMAASDRAAHERMQLVLCKVQRCEQLMRRYLDELHSSAKLMYTGHTSLDPHTLQQLPPSTPTAAATISLLRRPKLTKQQQQQQPPSQVTPATQQGPEAAASSQQQHTASSLAAATQPLRVLHVRGKSGLKHTKQLLECWALHPDWPQLTVVGPMPNEQVSGDEAKKFLAAPNIRAVNPGKQQGPNWPAFEPLPLAELSELLLSHAVHVMPSEREGFGHSINEGRAAGAVLLVPNHPPMNELVRGGSGVLLQPVRSFSHRDPPVPALGKYGNISVSMSPGAICAGMAQVLSKTPSQLVDLGKAARAAFESGRGAFLEAMSDVQQELQSLLQVAEAAAKMDGL